MPVGTQQKDNTLGLKPDSSDPWEMFLPPVGAGCGGPEQGDNLWTLDSCPGTMMGLTPGDPVRLESYSLSFSTELRTGREYSLLLLLVSRSLSCFNYR